MITYKWIISSMDCVIQETVEGQELQNVVNMIHWRRSATEGTEGEADYYYADVYGAMPLTSPDPNEKNSKAARYVPTGTAVCSSLVCGLVQARV